MGKGQSRMGFKWGDRKMLPAELGKYKAGKRVEENLSKGGYLMLVPK